MYELHGVDAFTDRPFAGNPAAVVPLDGDAWPPDAWMQALAANMNLSETAFVRHDGAGDRAGERHDGRFDLRWFTPGAEVDLCGHATVATAHVLWATGRLPLGTTARFATRSGELLARRLADGAVELDLPALPPEPVVAPAGLLAALGIEGGAGEVLRSRFDVVVVVPTEADVAALDPDLAALRRIDARGVIVTAPADAADVDLVSRFFAPAVGVDEDPVTGSAHCVLAPYWSVRLGRTALRARQISARGGDLRLALHGDRVTIAGHAVTVHSGFLRVAPPTA